MKKVVFSECYVTYRYNQMLSNVYNLLSTLINLIIPKKKRNILCILNFVKRNFVSYKSGSGMSKPDSDPRFKTPRSGESTRIRSKYSDSVNYSDQVKIPRSGQNIRIR